MTLRIPLILLVLFTVPAYGADVVRNTVVISKGEKFVYRTSAPIAVVTIVGTNAASKPAVKYQPEQYGQNITLTGLQNGEATLQVEDTTEKVSEVVRVLVAPKDYATSYQNVIKEFSSTDGIGTARVYATPPLVIIGGTAYSVRDLRHCMDMERNKSVVCAARLASVVATVGSDPLPPARASLQLDGASNDGQQSQVTRTVIRLGDVPVLALHGTDTVAIMNRAAHCVQTLNRAIADWAKNADTGQEYPTTFGAWSARAGLDVAMQWNRKQGVRGETILHIEPGETTGEGAIALDRSVGWQIAALTDSFRMYAMARPPSKTGTGADNPLQQVYDNALRVAKAPLDRSNSVASLVKSYVSLRWSTGKDPMDSFLDRIPAAFQPDARH